MGKTIRRLVIAVGILIGALIVLIVCVGLFFDVNRYKPQIESKVSKASGMSLKINGKMSLKVFPHVHVTLNDVRLANQGSELVTAKTMEISPRLFPLLLHKKVILNNFSMTNPKFHIEKNAKGHLNFETSGASKSAGGKPGEVGWIRIRNGEVAYVDRVAGQNIVVQGITADFSGISWNSMDLANSVTLHGNVQVQSLQATTSKGTKMAASNLKAGVRDDHGLIHLDPTEFNIFGGMARGSAKIDVRGATPKFEIAQTASHIDLGQAVPKFKDRISGNVDASLNLSGMGRNLQAVTKTTSGTITIRSQNITTSIDIDALASQLKVGQGMDLVGLGSSLFSGPLGTQISPLEGTIRGAPRSKKLIHNLVLDWQIDKGIAHARDVAFSTEKTVVAFKGNLNLVDKKYQNFYVATVDQNGCAKNKVEVVGTLNHPRPGARSLGKQLSQSYLGSAGSALGAAESKVAGVFGGQAEHKGGENQPARKSSKVCDQFYSGSAIHAG